jgi:hypothetical protein
MASRQDEAFSAFSTSSSQRAPLAMSSWSTQTRRPSRRKAEAIFSTSSSSLRE